MEPIQILNKKVGDNCPCLIIAEAGVNHNNDPQRALKLIEAAAKAGVDLIKFQTYKAEKLATKTAPRYWDSRLDTDGGGSQYDTFKRIDSLPLEAYFQMKKLCEKLGLFLTSTPFDFDSVDFLEDLDLPLFKIASADIVHLQLLRRVAKTGKPMILSTGAASFSEVEEAIKVIREEGNNKIILQHCMLSYPCDDKDANLNKMVQLKSIFSDLPVGYSDHTRGIVVPLAAVALGATTIEKHFTIDKSLPDSPDHNFSLDPDELGGLVASIRRVEASRGSSFSGAYEVEKKARLYARKSIVANVHIPRGTRIELPMLACKRPGTGLYPKFLDSLIGRVAQMDIKEDEIIKWDMF